MLSKRFYATAVMTAVVGLFAVQGCSDEDNPLCCTEFKVGATVDAKIGGSAQAQTAVQAVSDFSGIAAAAIDDLTTACRGMAEDLGAAQADRDAAEAKGDRKERMQAYCALAVTAIGTVKGQVGGTLTIVAKPPQCSASISAKANCEAKCTGGAKCDFKANPPKCTGGTLEVQCKGKCTADASVKATVKCEGKCTGSCTGSCTAQAGGVACKGKCEGTCKGQAQGGTGTGIQADGTCDGTCEGTCEVTAPSATCSGSCNGECSASCEASGEANASVKCDGKCDADFEPLQCTGGKLEGGCQVDVKCSGNCDASVKAKAECTPPSVEVAFSGAANLEAAAKLEGTLKANFGAILAFKARLEGMAEVAGTITGSADAIVDIKAACIPQVVAAGAAAVSDVQASVSATVSVAGAVGGS